MKKIPFEIDDFKELINGNYYFTDKSLIIKDVFEEESAPVILIPRPIKFGKSLNISMIKYFFTLKNAKENRKLFNGLKIESENIMDEQGKYPVIYISFKDVGGQSWEEFYNNMKSKINKLFSEYRYLLSKDSISCYKKEIFEKILQNTENQTSYESSIKFLCELLYEYHEVYPIILIDDYDHPIVSVATSEFYKVGHNFYMNLLGTSLKGNEYLKKAVLVGTLISTKERIYDGLDNIYISSILNSRLNYFGFSEDEIVELLKYYKKDYKVSEFKEWYGGYSFEKNFVYNPGSIINAFKFGELKAYRMNSPINDLIKICLSNISKSEYNTLVKLINNESIEIEMEENILLDSLDKESTSWNILLFSGYLNFTENKKIIFLNKEERNFYTNIFKKLASNDIREFNKLLRFLLNKDIQNFKGFLQEMFYTAVSYYDVGKEEKYYHNLMLGFVFGLSDRYKIRSNREYGTGRVDLLLKSKDNILPNYVFEFKVSDKIEDLEKDCEEALNQIDKKEYGFELDNPVKIGMSFYGKKFEILIKE